MYDTPLRLSITTDSVQGQRFIKIQLETLNRFHPCPGLSSDRRN